MIYFTNHLIELIPHNSTHMTIKIKTPIRSLLLLILLMLPPQTQSQTWKELLDCADSLYYRGKLDTAVILGERSLAMAIAKFGEIDTTVALAYQRTGKFHFTYGSPTTAEKYWNRVIEICNQTVGKKHLLYAKTLGYIALQSLDVKKYEKAESLFVEAIDLMEEILGLNNLDVARALNNYGAMLSSVERFAEAERVYKKTLKIREKICSPNDMDIAESVGNLSVIYRRLGNNVEADSLREICKKINIKYSSIGAPQTTTSGIYGYLAEDKWAEGDYAAAESLFVLAIDTISNWANNDGGDRSIDTRMQLGQMLTEIGKYTEAESVFVLAIQRDDYFNRIVKKQSIRLWNSLANLYSTIGKTSEAELLFHRSYSSVKDLIGIETAMGADVCYEMSRFYREHRQIEKALEYANQSILTQCKNIRDFSPILSEYRTLLYTHSLHGMIDNYFSCYLDLKESTDSHAEIASSIILKSKGLVTEEIAGKKDLVLEITDPGVRILVDSLKQVKHLLSGLYANGPQNKTSLIYRKQIDSLTKCSNMIESELALLSSEYRTTKTKNIATIQTIASALPRGASLIEYFAYNYINISETGSQRRYIVHVLNNSGLSSLYDLGPASRIDQVIHNYQIHFQNISKLERPLSSKEEKEYAELSTRLYNLLWKPISRLVEKSKLVFISPDGNINLVSFAGLMDKQGEYLVEKYPLQYLSTGRDLTNKKDRIQSAEGLLAIGDPDFDAAVTDRLIKSERMLATHEIVYVNPYQSRNVRSTCSSLHEIHADPLPSSRFEVNSISNLYKIKNPHQSVILMLGATSSEERFKKEVKNHRVIHLATHGYFIDGSCVTGNNKRITDDSYAGENPLLLSGLLLAGANLHGAGADTPGAEDGILTALEVSSLDLRGTDLVILSACETGLGKVEQGEGVYGLRRAFQLAGARTVVSSLWQVPDRETTTFMKILYSQNAKTYPELFQKAAIQRLKELRIRKQSTHPYTWAGFIATGDWKIR